MAGPIKPDIVFLGGHSQNLSVSGLAIDDVNDWLVSIPRNREVRRVVIYIGVNTCKFAEVTENMWRQLIHCPDLQRSAPGSVQQGEGAVCRSHRRILCPEPCAAEAPERGPYCIQATVARAGWCSTSSLLLDPTVARLATTSQAPALNRDKTQHSLSGGQEGIQQHHASRPSLGWLYGGMSSNGVLREV